VPETPKPNFLEILRTLTRHKVEFLVVGGVAAVLQGAPLNTFDLDIVHARNVDNLGRLLAGLVELDAHYRIKPEERRRPDASHLASPGHQLLMTRFGPLDLLGSIGSRLDYEALLPETIEMETGIDLRLRVLNLETLIRVKEEVGGEKDRAVLPVLRRTLAEKRGAKS
jgi:hypothetical protein